MYIAPFSVFTLLITVIQVKVSHETNNNEVKSIQ